MTRAIVHPFVQAPPARIHKEVADGGQLEAELLGDGELQLFGWALVFFEDGMECPSLHIGEHQTRLLRHVATLAAAMVLFLTFTCCKRGKERE